MPILTLTTDFGLHDGYSGVLKGVIWSICPAAQIADISHTIAPQDVLEGAYVLQRACPDFPAGTVHVAVVDPGVGTDRRPLALRLGSHYYVGPDNGLFTAVIERAERAGEPVESVHLTNPDYWLAHVSGTFHGRDIFAPVGAHLAKGVPLADLGPAIQDPLRLSLPRPERTPSGWRAHIASIDAFGNAATDLPVEALAGKKKIILRLAGIEIRGLVASYGGAHPGDPVALADSQGFVEVAVVGGSAARLLEIRVGDTVEVQVQG